MKILRTFGLAALSLAAFLPATAAVASATELYKWTSATARETVKSGTAVEATLLPGSSSIFKDGSGASFDTCTSSSLSGQTAGAGGTVVPVPLAGVVLTNCGHTTHVVKPGELTIEHITGTTNGTVRWSGLEFTVYSTQFGIQILCKTGAAAHLGTLTGASGPGQASLHVDGSVTCTVFGKMTWTGTYVVTTPASARRGQISRS